MEEPRRGLFLIGRTTTAVYERTFERPIGLAGDGQTIYVASLYQLLRLENVLAPGETIQGYDRWCSPATTP